MFVFFFSSRRRHTRWPRDWSSDVCSSDLLVSWAGALSILVFGPFFELFLSPLDAAITAARLPNILWFLILTFCFWRALFILAQTKEAQPLALPFGGEPNPRDYARMIADAGLLLLVAPVGLSWMWNGSSGVPRAL